MTVIVLNKIDNGINSIRVGNNYMYNENITGI